MTKTVGDSSRAQRGRAKKDQPSNFFTIARFGPDTLFIFALLILGSVALFRYGFILFAILACFTLLAIFAAESVEVIHQSRPQKKSVVGARCRVIRRITGGSRGVVRLYDSHGRLDPELWSGESTFLLEEGTVATVADSNGVILQITPLDEMGEELAEGVVP